MAAAPGGTPRTLIHLLRKHGVLFDINVTGVRPVLSGIGQLIGFADERAAGG